MRILRFLFGLAAIVGLGLAAMLLLARFNDGPIGPFPGGPLNDGDLVSDPYTDWRFVTDIPEIELQLEAQTTSRITWIVVKDGTAYVPCSLDFPPFKSWYETAAVDGRAILRIEGRRYPVTLTKIENAAFVEELKKIVGAKYSTGGRGDRVWFFKVDRRA